MDKLLLSTELHKEKYHILNIFKIMQYFIALEEYNTQIYS